MWFEELTKTWIHWNYFLIETAKIYSKSALAKHIWIWVLNLRGIIWWKKSDGRKSCETNPLRGLKTSTLLIIFWSIQINLDKLYIFIVQYPRVQRPGSNIYFQESIFFGPLGFDASTFCGNQNKLCFLLLFLLFIAELALNEKKKYPEDVFCLFILLILWERTPTVFSRWPYIFAGSLKNAAAVVSIYMNELNVCLSAVLLTEYTQQILMEWHFFWSKFDN